MKSFLESKGWPTKLTLMLLTDVAKGLSVLHTQGVIHSDIKAQNILIDLARGDQPVARIADFGLAKVRKWTQPSKGTYLYDGGKGSTLAFSSPESLAQDDAKPSRKWDIWAYGMMCIQVFSRDGIHPFEKLSPSQAVGITYCSRQFDYFY